MLPRQSPVTSSVNLPVKRTGWARVASSGGASVSGGNPPSARTERGLLASCRAASCSRRRCRQLAPDEPLAVDVDEFRCGHNSPPPLRVPAQRCAAPLPVGETGGSKGKGGGQGGGSPTRQGGSEEPSCSSRTSIRSERWGNPAGERAKPAIPSAREGRSPFRLGHALQRPVQHRNFLRSQALALNRPRAESVDDHPSAFQIAGVPHAAENSSEQQRKRFSPGASPWLR